jgi:hypothetical protein
MLGGDDCIYVRTVEGQTYNIPYFDSMTGKQLKNRIKARTGYPVDNQSVICRGREIEDTQELARANITKGQTVFFLPRLIYSFF